MKDACSPESLLERLHQDYATLSSMVIYFYLRECGRQLGGAGLRAGDSVEGFSEDISGFWASSMRAILRGVSQGDEDSFFEGKLQQVHLKAKLGAKDGIILIFETSLAREFHAALNKFREGEVLDGLFEFDPTMTLCSKPYRLKVLLKGTKFEVSDDTLTINLPTANQFSDLMRDYLFGRASW